MKLSSSEISQAVRAVRKPSDDGIVPLGYSIDSRTIQSGECFIAIKGPNFDGHQFIREALSKGACLVVAQAEADQPWPVEAPVLLVKDTLLALQQLATYVRRKWGHKVIAITGSTGKTTTKEITSLVLAGHFRVFRSMGNFNNDYGLPLSLLRLHELQEVAVLELGMSAPGEIARLSKIAGPNIGIITNVKPVHLEFFKSIDGIAKAKRELVEHLPEDGLAVLNNDDVRVRKFGRHFPQTFSTSEDFCLLRAKRRRSGRAATTHRLNERSYSRPFHPDQPSSCPFGRGKLLHF